MFWTSSPLVGRVRRTAAMAITAVVLAAAAPLASPAVTRALADTSNAAPSSGYWMVGSDGHVYPFGSAADLGSPTLPAGAHATHVEPTPDGGGYYVLDDRGDVFPFGDAQGLGNAAVQPGESAVSLSATPSGQGYWIFTSAGRVITKGDAQNLGDMSGKHLNAPVVSSTVTPDGSGYWMVAGDGGVFSFGAPFWGSTGNLKLNKPVEGIVPTATNKGYWLVASDGGVFAFGDAGFKGSMGATKLNKPVVGLVRYGDGYLMVASDGGIFDFSNLPFQGSLGAHPPANPIVGTAALPGGAAVGNPGGPGDTNPGGNLANPGNGGGNTGISLPAGQLPQTVSSQFRFTYGTPPDQTTLSTTKSGQELSQKVHAVLEAGNDIYVAGEFTNLVDPSHVTDSNPTTNPSSWDGTPATPPIPYLGQLDVTTGAPPASSAFNAAVQPSCKNASAAVPCGVFALALSPDGTILYVGGNFDSIGGGRSPKIAAIDVATGRLDPNWHAPAITSEVEALVVHNGLLYLGGAFTTVDSTPRAHLAALDLTSSGGLDASHGGNLDPNFGASLTVYPDYYSGQGAITKVGNNTVHSLAITADGSTLIAGGDFTDTLTHKGLLALDPATGNLTAWQPNNADPKEGNGRPGFQVAASPSLPHTFYVAEGGVGGADKSFTVGSVGGAPDWVGYTDGDSDGIAATSKEVYVGGHFGHVSEKAAGNTCVAPPCTFSGPGVIKTNQLVAFTLTGDGHGNAVYDNTWTAQADTPKGPDDLWLGSHGLYVGGGFFGIAATINQLGHNPYVNQPGLALFPPTS